MPHSPTENTARFGQFELDLRTRQLTKNGTKIRLSQQPIQVLSLLLENPGEIVTREEFRQRLWPSDIFVDFDHGLNKSIQKLRDALGDECGMTLINNAGGGGIRPLVHCAQFCAHHQTLLSITECHGIAGKPCRAGGV